MGKQKKKLGPSKKPSRIRNPINQEMWNSCKPTRIRNKKRDIPRKSKWSSEDD